jgi:predicted PurR-regulated permease PerM
VSGYVIGNLKISLIAGFGAWLAMVAIGIPFALPLAIVVAFFDLLPMIGATLAAIIVALVALLVGGTLLELLGALLAIPAAAAIQLVVQDLRRGTGETA